MEQAILDKLEEKLAAHETVVLATVLTGPRAGQALFDGAGRRLAGGFDSEELGAVVAASSTSYFADLRSGREQIQIDDQACDLFFEVYPPPPQIIVIGAVHVAIHLIGCWVFRFPPRIANLGK